jgi:thiamine-monophosphate kinase
MRLNRESYFISQFKSKYIGDDGALAGREVYLADGFFEGVHFKREWLSLSQIAYKSVAVNISDIYSMGAVPKYVLLTVAIPKSFTKEDLKLLASGFLEASREFGCEIVGGDTLSNIKLDISVTAIGEVVRKPLLRSGAESGDFIAYTGELGKSKRDLEKLLSGRGVRKDSPFLKPKLHGDFILKVSPLLSSGVDISDGLFSEMEHLSKSSGVDFRLFRKVQKRIACSGEEYQLLFTFPKRNRREILAIAKSLGVKINIFGEVKKGGKYTNFCKRHHF